MKYFIADTHFFHEPIIEFSQRPFKDIDDMNNQLIKNWNDTVTSTDDEIYILGDFMYQGTGENANSILKQLRGKKYLIKGNHEEYLIDKNFKKHYFEWVKDYYTFIYNKRKFVLFHYPILEWEDYYKHSIHLYGHVHSNKVDFFNRMLGINAVNVGVDMIKYKPISIDDIIRIVNEREMTL